MRPVYVLHAHYGDGSAYKILAVFDDREDADLVKALIDQTTPSMNVDVIEAPWVK